VLPLPPLRALEPGCGAGIGGTEVAMNAHLTKTEAVIYGALVEGDGAVVTRESLAQLATGYPDPHYHVNGHIWGLRRKVGFEEIQNIKGLGYRWTGGSKDWARAAVNESETAAARMEACRALYMEVMERMQAARPSSAYQRLWAS
jgi:hypothetical protein